MRPRNFSSRRLARRLHTSVPATRLTSPVTAAGLALALLTSPVTAAGLALALLTAGCAGDFRPALIATTALVACDAGQTAWASDGGRWDRVTGGREVVETDPLLGQRPSELRLAGTALAAAGIGALVYASRLPSWTKAAYFAAVGVVETAEVYHNAQWSGGCGLGGQAPTTYAGDESFARTR